jgi:5'-nucleotidase
LIPTTPCAPPKAANDNSIRFAFDFDRVLGVAYGRADDDYAHDSESWFREQGLRAYHERETALANVPAKPGPLAPFFLKVVNLRDSLSLKNGTQVEMHIVTARAAGSLMRVITTLDAWKCETKGLISCGSTPKAPQLQNLKADIFFDDSERHLADLPLGTLGALVPWVEPAPRRPKTGNNAMKVNNLNPQSLRKEIG